MRGPRALEGRLLRPSLIRCTILGAVKTDSKLLDFSLRNGWEGDCLALA